jgi:Zn-dependent protease with chaperone function
LRDDGFAEFYQRTFAEVLSATLMASGHRGDAEDAVQEAYIIALRRWAEVGEYDAPEAWVLKVALRRFWRSQRRHRHAEQLAVTPLLLAGLYAVGAAVAVFNLVIVSLPIVLYLALRHQLPEGKYSGALVAAASALIFGTVLTLSLSAIANGFRAVRTMGEPWKAIGLPNGGTEPLRDLIADVSAKLGTRAPHELRVTAAPNAAVTEQAWRVGMPGATRTLYLGLPLLVGMNTGELRAVISHEMAHYASGHARTSMLMHRGVVTLEAIRRALQLLIVTPPRRRSADFRPLMMLSWWFLYGYALVGYWAFTAYWALYWRLSFALRRGQEYDADRGAEPIVGAAALGGALRRAQGVAEAWGRFHREFVLPMRRAGCASPETFDALGRMITDGAYQETMRAWEGDLAGQSTAPTDTHPCLSDRLARLGGCGHDGNRAIGRIPRHPGTLAGRGGGMAGARHRDASGCLCRRGRAWPVPGTPSAAIPEPAVHRGAPTPGGAVGAGVHRDSRPAAQPAAGSPVILGHVPAPAERAVGPVVHHRHGPARRLAEPDRLPAILLTTTAACG